jgi:hypothetical protein
MKFTNVHVSFLSIALQCAVIASVLFSPLARAHASHGGNEGEKRMAVCKLEENWSQRAWHHYQCAQRVIASMAGNGTDAQFLVNQCTSFITDKETTLGLSHGVRDAVKCLTDAQLVFRGSLLDVPLKAAKEKCQDVRALLMKNADEWYWKTEVASKHANECITAIANLR